MAAGHYIARRVNAARVTVLGATEGRPRGGVNTPGGRIHPSGRTSRRVSVNHPDSPRPSVHGGAADANLRAFSLATVVSRGLPEDDRSKAPKSGPSLGRITSPRQRAGFSFFAPAVQKGVPYDREQTKGVVPIRKG
jgi:hypothetical protein